MSLEAFFRDTDDLAFDGAGEEEEARGALVDVLDRLLDRGVVIFGDLRVSVADVDLLFVGLKVFISSIDTIEDAREAALDRAGVGRAAPPAKIEALR